MSLKSASDWTNSRLVEECLRGNELAWHALVDRYKKLIYSIPMRYGATPQDAADIFQGVCIDLFNELPRLRNAEALQGWLIRVATHRCYHWKRQQDPNASEWDEDHIGGLSGDAPIPPDLLADLEREQILREAIASLPPRCRKMIDLLFFEHPPLPYNEVAQKLSLARGSIGFIRGRCLKRLKKILEEKGF
ncbi:MAG TPA: sigma-70 family RNA polymerase sigma factor [Bryobacteraceae bacterium]|nr:sigma-70 family RNA polymerase sigma factor [Bryobacteraceae bacterium]